MIEHGIENDGPLEPSADDMPSALFDGLTDAQRVLLAKDIRTGQIFGSWNIPHDVPIQQVFVPLAHGVVLPDNVTALYEYRSNATQRRIGGCPTFMSYGMLTGEDCLAIDHINDVYRHTPVPTSQPWWRRLLSKWGK